MARVLFTPLAHNDLQIIWDYLAEEASEETADGILEFIQEKCQKIAAFPESGHIRYELLANLRSFVVKSYVVFYIPLSDGIDVLRVLHGARDIESVFEDMIPPAQPH
jgi:toxin ParE1/3/4